MQEGTNIWFYFDGQLLSLNLYLEISNSISLYNCETISLSFTIKKLLQKKTTQLVSIVSCLCFQKCQFSLNILIESSKLQEISQITSSNALSLYVRENECLLHSKKAKITSSIRKKYPFSQQRLFCEGMDNSFIMISEPFKNFAQIFDLLQAVILFIEHMIEDDSFQLYREDQLFDSSQEDIQSSQQQCQLAFSPFGIISERRVLSQYKVKDSLLKKVTVDSLSLKQGSMPCEICQKHAMNGMVCKSKECCKLFCGECAAGSIKKLGNRCPSCQTPCQLFPSSFRSRINKMEVVCQLCNQKYTLQQEQTHYKSYCRYFKRVTCQFCQELIPQDLIAKHTRQEHEDKLDQIISKLQNNRPVFDCNQLLAKRKFYLNTINKTPQLGTTGKFYCGQRLQDSKFTDFKGYCGPTNGQNCIQCMKLDILRFTLPKGYLVNSNGDVCWKKNQDFICGVMICYKNISCKEGNPCKACISMKNNINRYTDCL